MSVGMRMGTEIWSHSGDMGVGVVNVSGSQ